MGRDQKRTYRVFFATHGRSGPWTCDVCSELIYRHGTRRGDGNIHHKDENVENDAPENLVMIHTYCHRRQHQTGQQRPQWVRDKIAAGHTGVGAGRTHSDETRAKIAAGARRAWAARQSR